MRNLKAENRNHKSAFVLAAIIVLAAAVVTISACDDEGSDTVEECGGHGHLHDDECHCDNGYTNDPDDATKCVPTDEQGFECSEDKNGWEQCVDNKVQWCHTDHFHWGADCEALGYECVQLTESTAACVDDSSDCTVGDFKCEDNTAYNCIEEHGNGHWAIKPCGTAATCHEHAEEAHCESGESDFEPQDACDAVSGDDEESKAVVTAFEDVFSTDYHADLGVKVHVTLPDNEVSYIHFPVFLCGEFAVFMDQTDLFDGILHRDETEMTVSGGTAVGVCEEDIPEHWHADLEWDGEGTEGESPVPYVIRFKAVEGGAEVHFAVFQIAAEED